MAYPSYRGRARSRVYPYNARPQSRPLQISQPCMIYTRTGRCDQRPACRYQHIPGRTAICQQFIKSGRCSRQGNERCSLSHKPHPENMPMCVHYARGRCNKEDCQFAHMTNLGENAESVPTCRTFALNGWCDRGLACTKRHSFECPDFEAYGKCPNKACRLQHVIKAEALAEAHQPQSAIAKVSSAVATLSGTSEMVNVAQFVEFLKTASRQSCNHAYLPSHEGDDNSSQDSDARSQSDSDSDIDFARDEPNVNEEPLDTGADFISV